MEVELSDELTHDQVMRLLGERGGEAYSQIIGALAEQPTDLVLVRREDLFFLVADQVVSAGLEVHVAALQGFLDSVRRMANEGDSISSRKVRALILALEEFSTLGVEDAAEQAGRSDRRTGGQSDGQAESGFTEDPDGPLGGGWRRA